MQQPNVAERAHRFLVLDSLRGVCACLVALGHFVTPAHLQPAGTHLFVDFFFVLSGFVIAASYGKRLADGYSIRTFMGLRLGRIYPLHLAVLLLMLASELALHALLPGMSQRGSFDEAHSVGGFVASLFLVQIFYGQDVAYWNAVSWSIAAELWTYLLFAWMFRFAGRWVVRASLLVALPMPFLVWQAIDGRPMDAFHDGAFFRCIYGFALGVAAFFASRSATHWLRKLSVVAATVLEMAMVAGIAIYAALLGRTGWAFVAPVLFFLVVLGFTAERGAVSRLLRLPPFVLLGTLSYSIYMVHHYIELRAANALAVLQRLSHGRLNLVEQVGSAQRIGTTPVMGDFLVIAIMLVVIGISYLSYRWIEHPARVWSRRLVLGTRARPMELLAERDAPTF